MGPMYRRAAPSLAHLTAGSCNNVSQRPSTGQGWTERFAGLSAHAKAHSSQYGSSIFHMRPRGRPFPPSIFAPLPSLFRAPE